MHAKALHGAVAARDGAVGHRPHQHVGDFGHQRGKVPERVVCGSRLRHGEVRLGLGGMDQVRKLHRVLNEEDRNVVAHQIPVAFVRVELHGEAAHISCGVGRAAFAEDGRETDEDRCLLSDFAEERGACELGNRFRALEKAVCRRSARMDNPLGDALVVEMGDLLAKDEVFEQRGAAETGLQGALVVRDGDALVRGERAVG
jgi:hypothetical protein